MKQFSIRIAVAWAIAHVLVIFYAFLAPLFGSADWKEVLEILQIVTPMFATFTTMVVKHVMKTPAGEEKGKSISVSSAVRFLSFLFPASYIGLTLILMTCFVKSMGLEFRTLKLLLGALEISVGSYVGIIFSSIFEAQTAGRRAAVIDSAKRGGKKRAQ